MSKFRSIYKLSIIAVILFILLLYGFMIFMVLHFIIEDIENSGNFKEWKGIFLLLFILTLIGLSIKHFFKYFFKVIITEIEILIGKRTISLEEIEHISIREKVDFMFLFHSFTYEAVVLYLKNGEKLPIGVENYANGNLIQHNLEQFNKVILKVL